VENKTIMQHVLKNAGKFLVASYIKLTTRGVVQYVFTCVNVGLLKVKAATNAVVSIVCLRVCVHAHTCAYLLL
jgi:hypothetical protein